MIRIITLSLILAIVLPACRTSVAYTGLRPADITLPSNIKSVVLVNRYKADRRNSWMNIVEGIFTGEMLFADRRGVEYTLSSLQQRLMSGPKYQVVIANEQLSGTGTGMLPPPISQGDVQRLLTNHDSQAVIAIEAFDSDIAVRTEPRERKRTVNGKEVLETYFVAFEVVRITIGWRIYGLNGSVIDQHQITSARTFSARGNTPALAQSNLLFPMDAIMQTGTIAGDAYGVRIAPSWVFYRRNIYSKASGSAGMKKARRMAQRGDWNEATAIWERLSSSDDTRLAKRSTYNLAVAAEMEGDFDKALSYARKAANNYGLREADSYIFQLNRRLEELQRLDMQMNEEQNE
ncbi:MAG: DUF6340 family protein [Bacteroidia bacterium]